MTTYLCKRDSIEFYDLDDLCANCEMGEIIETEKGMLKTVCIGEFREVLR
jgi:hypothetical protein